MNDLTMDNVQDYESTLSRSLKDHLEKLSDTVSLPYEQFNFYQVQYWTFGP